MVRSTTCICGKFKCKSSAHCRNCYLALKERVERVRVNGDQSRPRLNGDQSRRSRCYLCHQLRSKHLNDCHWKPKPRHSSSPPRRVPPGTLGEFVCEGRHSFVSNLAVPICPFCRSTDCSMVTSFPHQPHEKDTFIPPHPDRIYSSAP